jgi:hypothetical protein
MSSDQVITPSESALESLITPYLAGKGCSIKNNKPHCEKLPINIDDNCTDQELATLMWAIHSTLYLTGSKHDGDHRTQEVHIIYKETGSPIVENYYVARTKYYAILAMTSKYGPKGKLAGYVSGLDGDAWVVVRKPTTDVTILPPQKNLPISAGTPYVPGHSGTIYVNRNARSRVLRNRVYMANDRTMNFSSTNALKFEDQDVSHAAAFYEYIYQYDRSIHDSKMTDNPLTPNYFIVGQPPGTLFTQYFNPKVEYRSYTRNSPGNSSRQVNEEYLELEKIEFGQTIDFIIGSVNASNEFVGTYHFIDTATSIVKPIPTVFNLPLDEIVRQNPEFRNGIVVNTGVNSRGVTTCSVYDYNYGFREVSKKGRQQYVGTLKDRQWYTQRAREAVKSVTTTPLHRAPYPVNEFGKVVVCSSDVCENITCGNADVTQNAESVQTDTQTEIETQTDTKLDATPETTKEKFAKLFLNDMDSN